MYSGYVLKRNSSNSAPPMKRVYCTLWGTLLLDYDSEEEAKTSMAPKCVLELIGASKWDGQIGNTKYDNGLLVVSHIGTTYYMSAPNATEKNEWITFVRAALECNFANPSTIEVRASKASFEAPLPVGNVVCPITGTKVAHASGLVLCTSCGRGFVSECLNEAISVLQIGYESPFKVCQHCREAQACLLWLKKLLNVHALLLHEQTPEVLEEVNRFKASFKIRRQSSSRLDMAASLREQESVTDEEFEELRRVDYEYRQEHMLFEFNRMKDALEVLGTDMQSMLGFLSNPSGLSGTQNGTIDSIHGSLKLYFLVVLRLVTLADADPDLIDFYWPQIIHIHLLLSKSQTPSAISMVDLLQQGLLAIALKYPQLATKLAWSLLAAVGDYAEKKITQSQYAACVCLFLQLEVHTYGVASSLTGIENSFSNTNKIEDAVPTAKTSNSILMNILTPAGHQKQELVIELYTLIRIRRRAHDMHDMEMIEAHDIIAHKEGAMDNEELKSFPVFNNANVANIFASWSGVHKRKNRLYCVDLFLDNFNERHHYSMQVEKAKSDDPNNSNDEKESNEAEVDTIGSPDINSSRRIIWRGLSDQLDWVETLTDIVDTLRFVERPLRTEVLKSKLNESICLPDGELRGFALDPTGVAGEPLYRMKKLFVEETRVFRTKARAPSLLVFEVEILDSSSEDELRCRGYSADGESGSEHGKRSRTHTGDQEDISVDDDMAEVQKILDSKMQATISSIHKAEVERKAEGEDSSMYPKPVHRRSVSETDLPESAPSAHALPSSPLRSSSAINLAASGNGDSAQRSRRLSTAGNYNAITKVEFTDHSESLPESETVECEDDLPISIPRISDDIPEEEIQLSQKVIKSAVKLYNQGLITKEEYEELVKSNAKYRNEARYDEEEVFREKVRSFFGMDWDTKKQLLLGPTDLDASTPEHLLGDDVNSNHDDRDRRVCFEDPNGVVDGAHKVAHSWQKHWPQRDLRCFIVKSNDDLRQEVACIQLIELCQEIFAECGLQDTLWLKPYRIVSTGPSAGFVETLPNTMSIDAIKKTENFVSLPHFFQNLYGGSIGRMQRARKNFVASLAAYSLVTYIFGIKDRHNGNILIDQEGHMIHIDFGFLLGIAPGGSFSIESAPFKLTEEMLEVFGGIDSDLFNELVKAFTQGFLALRSKSSAIMSAVSLIANDSTFPCFQGKDVTSILDKLRQRFKCELSNGEAIEYCLELIIQSYSNLGTRQYDSFQWYSNGIIP